MCAKIKEILTTLQVSILFYEILELMPKFDKFMKALLKGVKQKVVKQQVNMTEKDETTVPQTFPPKIKDPCKFTIFCNICGVKIPQALCDLAFSIKVMPLNKAKKLNLVEIIQSTMTVTLVDSSVTNPLRILQDVLVHADGLMFPADFMVLDAK